MDDALDIAWDKIVDGFGQIGAMLDRLLAPLNERLGPAIVILLLVIGLVALTKFLNRVYTTKRHAELKANYEHWYELRMQAMTCEDREKGRLLARNIDQAQLNKAYYDYFFEGFLKSIITTILPVLFVAAYINSAYGPQTLSRTIGREFIFQISRSGSEPIRVGAFFWFVICLVLVHLAWFVIKVIGNRLIGKKGHRPGRTIDEKGNANRTD